MVTVSRKPSTWPTESWPSPSTNMGTTFFQEQVNACLKSYCFFCFHAEVVLTECNLRQYVSVHCRWHVWGGSRERAVLLPQCSSERRHRWPEWVHSLLLYKKTHRAVILPCWLCLMNYVCVSGYRQLFQPVIKQVVDFYQPTCIVLQVRLFWISHICGFPFRLD